MRKDNHHILIKNLSTNEEQGFMLASGDTPYSIQGVDNVAQRIADGEILYSDFTNSRVFAQSDWSEGVSRYWDPERIYSVIYPSKKYKDKKNIIINEGEFTLGGSVSDVFTHPFSTGTGPMCRGESAGIVYAGSGMILYRSTDYGNTWSSFKDFTSVAQLSDVNEITDIVITDTEPMTMTHTGGLGTVSIGTIQELFVCFYNRTTKASGIARYDIDFTVRASTGSTYTSGGSVNSSAAYGSKRDSFTINTNGISTGSVAAYKVNNTYGLTIPSTWNSYGLFPGQKIKLTRTATGVVYNLTVSSVGGSFGGANEIGVASLPNYDSVTDANNFYTIKEIGQNSPDICFPVTGGIDSIISIGYGLGQNFIYNGVTYNVRGLGNGQTRYGNIPTFTPGVSSGSSDFIMVRRIDGANSYPLYGNGSITVNTEKWIYKYGTYLNKITKFVRTSKERDHIWGYNHIDPQNKLYDVGFGEMATNCQNSLVYANSLEGVLHSSQNHTITFNDGDCPISGTGAGIYANIMYIGTQYGSDGSGTQGSLLRFTLVDTDMTAPTYSVAGVVGERGISCMTYFASLLYIGTNDKGYIYEYNNTPQYGPATLTQIAKLPVDPTTGIAYIDSMTSYAGKIVCSYQYGSGIYQIDPNSRQSQAPLIEIDSLCLVDTLTNTRMQNLCNTGGGLLFSDGLNIYSYDSSGVASQGYMESSIYGGYISNVDKLWVYAYVRVGKWEIDDGQRVAMQVSMDEGLSWSYLPIVPGKPFGATNPWNDIYSISKGTTEDDQQLTFFFPYNTKSGTILYRCWLKKGATIKPVVNHIGVHFNINYKQELLFNYQLDLNKAMELLGGRTIEKDLQSSKLAFLKNIWQNQDMVQLTDVTGKIYTCMPFSDDRTPGQGLVISTSNSNTAHLDLDNLTYRVAFSLKTIANYEKTL